MINEENHALVFAGDTFVHIVDDENRQAAEEAAERAEDAAAEAEALGAIPNYKTISEVGTQSVPASRDVIAVLGYYAAGDGGGAEYRRVASEPAHDGKVQSADGAWWEIIGDEVPFECFGAGQSNPNDGAWARARSWAQSVSGVVLLASARYEFAYNSDFAGVPVRSLGNTIFASFWTSMAPVINVVGGIVSFQCTNPDFFSDKNSAACAFSDEFTGSETGRTGEVVQGIGVGNFIPYCIQYSGGVISPPAPLTSGFSFGSDTVSFDIGDSGIPATSFAFGLAPVQIGALVEADIRVWSGANSTKGIILVGEDFSIIVWLDSGVSIFAPTVYWRNHANNESGSFTLWNVHGSYVQEGMSFNNAVLGVRFDGPTRAQIMVNGSCIGIVGAPTGYYTGWGFGVYKPTSISTGTYSLNHPTATWGATVSLAPVKLLAFGDSITDSAHDTWYERAVRMIHGSNGSYVYTSKNIGVAGDTALDQLEALNGENVSGFNLVMGMVGTNDIQGQTDISAFKTTIRDIIDRATAGGAMLVLAVPPQFYSRQLASNYGVVGANPQNSSSGAMYRTAIAAVVASAKSSGVPVELVDMGRLASVNLAQNMITNYAITPDNIHPSGSMAQTIASAFVRGLNNLLRNGSSTMTRKAIMPSRFFLNGWSTATGFASYYEVGPNQSKKVAFNISGTVSEGVTVANLPPMLRPLAAEIRPAGSNTTSGTCRVQIDTNGDVRIFGAQGYVCFDAEYR